MVRLGFLHLDIHDYFTYRELARRMVASAKRAMPDIEIVQMTDQRSKIIDGVDNIQLAQIGDGDEFMPYRLMQLMLFDGDAIFLDTDVIVRKDLRDAFKEDFDIGLTKRDYPIIGRQTGRNISGEMPYNTGVMFSRSPQFFSDAYQYVMTLDKENQQWWGDQIAVNHVAKSGKHKVKEFPCETWNRVPVRMDDYQSETYVSHYKGDKRKAWMLA